MADPISITIGVGLLTNLLSHPLCKVLDSEPVRRFCLICEDQTRQRSFAKIFDAVRQRLPADQRRYVDFLNDQQLLRHDEGFELHKLFGGAEAPDTAKLAAVFRRLWPHLPANIDFILDAFVRDLEGELRRHPDFAPWIAYREVAETRADVRDIKAHLAKPPRPAPPPAPFTVPAPVADFTGREAELAQLEAALTRGGRAAISAVAGLGGVGKSQLALEVCRRLAVRFPDGQLFLDMRGTAADPLAPDQAMARVVEALTPGVRPPADLEGARAAYLSALRGRRALLLLDNARDQTQVEGLAPPPPCAMLVTSRARIVLPGAKRIDLDSLPEPEAVALLREILDAERPLAEAELTTLAERCARLPLALRVAGSFLLSHPATAITTYLRDLAAARLRRLGEVDAVLRLSVEALERERPELAGLWRCLAVFPAGFRPDAAAAVWQVDEEEAGRALDKLYGRSLVQYERTVERFRLHDLLRDLAAEGLDDAAREEAAARHAAHYVDVLGQCDRLYLQPGRHLEGLALFDAERVNIEAAQAWAASRMEQTAGAANLASRLSGAGVQVLELRLMARERVAWLEIAAEGCRRSGDRRREGAALGNLGTAWADLGEARKAVGYYEQALAVFREINDRRDEANSLSGLGTVWAALGETRRAAGYHEQHLVIAREIGDRRGEGNALMCSAIVEDELDVRECALSKAVMALKIYRQIEDPWAARAEAWLRDRGIEP